MRHRVYGKHLGRDKNQRTALFKGLVRELFLHETISTTEAKAKAIKGLVDKLIVKAQKKTNASMRLISSFFSRPETEKRLEEIALRYKGRSSGFTQIVRLGPRKGDGAMMVRINLISGEKEAADSKSEKTEKERTRPKKTAKKEKK